MRPFLILALSVFLITSCSKDDTTPSLPVASSTFNNLAAPSGGSQGTEDGDFIKFSFSEGAVVTSDDWDIAFRGTTILVNGGTASAADEPSRTGEAGIYTVTGTLASVTAVNESLFTQDAESGLAISTGSGNGWYSYAGPPTHLISPIAGKVIVIKTHDGHFAKMEILSYYKDAPANPDAFTDEEGYYTFNYVYQPNDGVTTFE